ncbi:MAG: hypothetical protein R3E31_17705 [Chloroflexota bacterium]
MRQAGSFLLISVAIYLTVTAVLIITDRPTNIVSAEEPIAFTALIEADYDGMPALQPYIARDGAELSYRLYESGADTDTILILLHGSRLAFDAVLPAGK